MTLLLVSLLALPVFAWLVLFIQSKRIGGEAKTWAEVLVRALRWLSVWFEAAEVGLNEAIISYRDRRWEKRLPPACEKFRPWVKEEGDDSFGDLHRDEGGSV
jgi:hypothetical protein